MDKYAEVDALEKDQLREIERAAEEAEAEYLKIRRRNRQAWDTTFAQLQQEEVAAFDVWMTARMVYLAMKRHTQATSRNE